MEKVPEAKQVECWSLDGVLLYTFPSVTAAAKFLGVEKQHISRAANKRRKTAYNHIWRFKDDK